MEITEENEIMHVPGPVYRIISLLMAVNEPNYFMLHEIDEDWYLGAQIIYSEEGAQIQLTSHSKGKSTKKSMVPDSTGKWIRGIPIIVRFIS
jgi:hypothetical protein